ncbi:MAG TPA: depupylase/deamidase Dop [Nitrospiria bacterium]|nr:depupylase/deamidase Dop [Nitrospiria bacterium]
MSEWLFGTETEFGVAARDPMASDPVSTAMLLINSYPALPANQALWDYENENPLKDARGFEVEGERERPGPEYNRLLNKLLANGGRLYVDGAHPEYSTPECTNPKDVVRFEKAGERALDLCREMAGRLKGAGDRFVIYKNNTDNKGNSYGYHENYLVPRSVPFDRLAELLIPFFVTRQLYAGAGKVGAEPRRDDVVYQLSQRADFFEVLVDLNTMVKRPIINTRDEPHADPGKYRRFHVIVGDATMSEYATYLKVGATALVLKLAEAGQSVSGVQLEDPVGAVKAISRDPTLTCRVALKGGGTATAIEIQRRYCDVAARLRETPPWASDVVSLWASVLDQLAEEPRQLARRLDWVMKRELIESYMVKKGIDWDDPRIALMDLQFHDLRLDRGLYYKLEREGFVDRLLGEQEIVSAAEYPPADTRAYFRSACLKKFPKEIYAASWTSVLFEAGGGVVKRVPLMEPLRGTAALTERLVKESDSVEQLLDRLTGQGG